MSPSGRDGTFNAFYTDGKESGFRQLTRGDLQDGDVLVSVEYSSLNYKDGLALTGKGKVIRKFPMIPGIDLAGTVVESSSAEYKKTDSHTIEFPVTIAPNGEQTITYTAHYTW